MTAAPFRNVEPITRPELIRELVARPHPDRIPDGEYIALCNHVHHDRHSRNYGERVYLDFQIVDGEYQGKTLRMFLRPSRFPTSNFYRAWAIARGGPPRSRNTRMSPRIFTGKVFRVLTATVRPRHRLTGDDGKQRPGPFLPESFWYSKAACLLSLELTNEPVIVTDFFPKSLSSCQLSQGRVGSGELGDGSKRENEFAVRDGKTVATPLNQSAETGNSLPTPSPQLETGRKDASRNMDKYLL